MHRIIRWKIFRKSRMQKNKQNLACNRIAFTILLHHSLFNFMQQDKIKQKVVNFLNVIFISTIFHLTVNLDTGYYRCVSKIPCIVHTTQLWLHETHRIRHRFDNYLALVTDELNMGTCTVSNPASEQCIFLLQEWASQSARVRPQVIQFPNLFSKWRVSTTPLGLGPKLWRHRYYYRRLWTSNWSTVFKKNEVKK